MSRQLSHTISTNTQLTDLRLAIQSIGFKSSATYTKERNRSPLGQALADGFKTRCNAVFSEIKEQTGISIEFDVTPTFLQETKIKEAISNKEYEADIFQLSVSARVSINGKTYVIAPSSDPLSTPFGEFQGTVTRHRVDVFGGGEPKLATVSAVTHTPEVNAFSKAMLNVVGNRSAIDDASKETLNTRLFDLIYQQVFLSETSQALLTAQEKNTALKSAATAFLNEWNRVTADLFTVVKEKQAIQKELEEIATLLLAAKKMPLPDDVRTALVNKAKALSESRPGELYELETNLRTYAKNFTTALEAAQEAQKLSKSAPAQDQKNLIGCADALIKFFNSSTLKVHPKNFTQLTQLFNTAEKMTVEQLGDVLVVVQGDSFAKNIVEDPLSALTEIKKLLEKQLLAAGVTHSSLEVTYDKKKAQHDGKESICPIEITLTLNGKQLKLGTLQYVLSIPSNKLKRIQVSRCDQPILLPLLTDKAIMETYRSATKETITAFKKSFVRNYLVDQAMRQQSPLVATLSSLFKLSEDEVNAYCGAQHRIVVDQMLELQGVIQRTSPQVLEALRTELLSTEQNITTLNQELSLLKTQSGQPNVTSVQKTEYAEKVQTIEQRLKDLKTYLQWLSNTILPIQDGSAQGILTRKIVERVVKDFISPIESAPTWDSVTQCIMILETLPESVVSRLQQKEKLTVLRMASAVASAKKLSSTPANPFSAVDWKKYVTRAAVAVGLLAHNEELEEELEDLEKKITTTDYMQYIKPIVDAMMRPAYDVAPSISQRSAPRVMPLGATRSESSDELLFAAARPAATAAAATSVTAISAAPHDALSDAVEAVKHIREKVDRLKQQLQQNTNTTATQELRKKIEVACRVQTTAQKTLQDLLQAEKNRGVTEDPSLAWQDKQTKDAEKRGNELKQAENLSQTQNLQTHKQRVQGGKFVPYAEPPAQPAAATAGQISAPANDSLTVTPHATAGETVPKLSFGDALAATTTGGDTMTSARSANNAGKLPGAEEISSQQTIITITADKIAQHLANFQKSFFGPLKFNHYRAVSNVVLDNSVYRLLTEDKNSVDAKLTDKKPATLKRILEKAYARYQALQKVGNVTIVTIPESAAQPTPPQTQLSAAPPSARTEGGSTSDRRGSVPAPQVALPVEKTTLLTDVLQDNNALTVESWKKHRALFSGLPVRVYVAKDETISKADFAEQDLSRHTFEGPGKIIFDNCLHGTFAPAAFKCPVVLQHVMRVDARTWFERMRGVKKNSLSNITVTMTVTPAAAFAHSSSVVELELLDGITTKKLAQISGPGMTGYAKFISDMLPESERRNYPSILRDDAFKALPPHQKVLQILRYAAANPGSEIAKKVVDYMQKTPSTSRTPTPRQPVPAQGATVTEPLLSTTVPANNYGATAAAASAAPHTPSRTATPPNINTNMPTTPAKVLPHSRSKDETTQQNPTTPRGTGPGLFSRPAAPTKEKPGFFASLADRFRFFGPKLPPQHMTTDQKTDTPDDGFGKANGAIGSEPNSRRGTLTPPKK